MYIPIGKICTVKGFCIADTLVDVDNDVKLPTKQKFNQQIFGFIMFIRNGDGVCDVDINDLIRYHNSHGKIATLTAVLQDQSKGVLDIGGDNAVKSFREKNISDGAHINAGFTAHKCTIVIADIISGCRTCDIRITLGNTQTAFASLVIFTFLEISGAAGACHGRSIIYAIILESAGIARIAFLDFGGSCNGANRIIELERSVSGSHAKGIFLIMAVVVTCGCDKCFGLFGASNFCITIHTDTGCLFHITVQGSINIVTLNEHNNTGFGIAACA